MARAKKEIDVLAEFSDRLAESLQGLRNTLKELASSLTNSTNAIKGFISTGLIPLVANLQNSTSVLSKVNQYVSNIIGRFQTLGTQIGLVSGVSTIMTNKLLGFIKAASPYHFQILSYHLERVKATIGAKLIPYVNQLIVRLDKLAKQIGGLSNESMRLIIGLTVALPLLILAQTLFKALAFTLIPLNTIIQASITVLQSFTIVMANIAKTVVITIANLKTFIASKIAYIQSLISSISTLKLYIIEKYNYIKSIIPSIAQIKAFVSAKLEYIRSINLSWASIKTFVAQKYAYIKSLILGSSELSLSQTLINAFFTSMRIGVMGLLTVLGPIAIVFTIIATVIAQSGAMMELFNKVMAMLSNALSPLIPVFDQIAAQFLPILEELFTNIAGIFATLAPVIGDLFSVLAKIAGVLVTLLGEVLVALTPIIELILEVIVQILEELTPLLDVLMMLVEPIQLIVEIWVTLARIVIGLVMPVLKGLINAIVTVVKYIMDIITKFLSWLFKGLKNVFQGIAGFMEDQLGIKIGREKALVSRVKEKGREIKKKTEEEQGKGRVQEPTAQVSTGDVLGLINKALTSAFAMGGGIPPEKQTAMNTSEIKTKTSETSTNTQKLAEVGTATAQTIETSIQKNDKMIDYMKVISDDISILVQDSTQQINYLNQTAITLSLIHEKIIKLTLYNERILMALEYQNASILSKAKMGFDNLYKKFFKGEL